MDTTRISVARLLALGVPLTWEDAVAVAQEAAMRCDIDAAMSGSPPLVSSNTCYVTPEGDLDLPVTTDVESPDAIKGLLRELLAGRNAPDALMALANGRVTHDIYGELGRFPVPNRRATIADLAARALALQARSTAGEPREPVATETPALKRPSAVAVDVVAAVAPAPKPASAPQVAAVAPPPQRPSAPPPAVPVPAVPRVDVRDVPLLAQIGFTAELQRLRLKSVNAGSVLRAPARFTMARRGRAIAAGGLLAGLLVALIWSASGRAPGAPRPIEPKSVASPLPLWPFAATVLPVTPDLPASAAPRSVASSPALARLGASMTPDGAVPVFEVSSRLAPDPGAPGIAPAPRDSSAGAEVSPAPVPIAPATVAPAVRELPEMAARAPVADPAVVRRAGTADIGRVRATRREVFTAGDADVAPPALHRQQLPTAVLEPGSVVPEGWPYLRLVVDETGAVESVRLTARPPGPGQSLYRHRMLVAAAKAWQFEPAIRDGQPVRYEIRVPLEP